MPIVNRADQSGIGVYCPSYSGAKKDSWNSFFSLLARCGVCSVLSCSESGRIYLACSELIGVGTIHCTFFLVCIARIL